MCLITWNYNWVESTTVICSTFCFSVRERCSFRVCFLWVMTCLVRATKSVNFIGTQCFLTHFILAFWRYLFQLLLDYPLVTGGSFTDIWLSSWCVYPLSTQLAAWHSAFFNDQWSSNRISCFMQHFREDFNMCASWKKYHI